MSAHLPLVRCPREALRRLFERLRSDGGEIYQGTSAREIVFYLKFNAPRVMMSKKSISPVGVILSAQDASIVSFLTLDFPAEQPGAFMILNNCDGLSAQAARPDLKDPFIGSRP